MFSYYDTIASDIRGILGEAYSQTKEQRKKTITGHTVMRVIEEKWKQLKAKSFEIWGDEE